MGRKIKAILASLLILPTLTITSGAVLAADPFNPLDKACQGAAASSPTCQDAKGTENPVAGPNGIINKTPNIIALVAGIGAVIMIIIGAFEFVTAGGTGFKAAAGAAPTKAAKARARISSAVIGLVVVALAWALVRLITNRVLQ